MYLAIEQDVETGIWERVTPLFEYREDVEEELRLRPSWVDNSRVRVVTERRAVLMCEA